MYSYVGGNPINYIDPYGLDRYSFSVNVIIGIKISWGSENGVRYFEGGFQVTPNIGIGGEYTDVDIPKHYQLNEENLTGSFMFSGAKYSGYSYGIKNTPLKRNNCEIDVGALGFNTVKDDFIRGIGKEGSIFPGGRFLTTEYTTDYENNMIVYPLSGNWFGVNIGAWGMLGGSWRE